MGIVKGWQDLNIKNTSVKYRGKNYRRVLAIGDIHGQFDKLTSIYKKISVTRNDLVIFLGDYIKSDEDCGDLETLQWLMEKSRRENFIMLLGNTELNFIWDCFDECGNLLTQPKKMKKWSVAKKLQGNVELADKIYKFLLSLRLSFKLTLGEKTFVFSHAGFEYKLFGADKFNANNFLVKGHSPVQKVFGKRFTTPTLKGDNVLLLDTGAKQINGRISCVNILTGEYWQSAIIWK